MLNASIFGVHICVYVCKDYTLYTQMHVRVNEYIVDIYMYEYAYIYIYSRERVVGMWQIARAC